MRRRKKKKKRKDVRRQVGSSHHAAALLFSFDDLDRRILSALYPAGSCQGAGPSCQHQLETMKDEPLILAEMLGPTRRSIAFYLGQTIDAATLFATGMVGRVLRDCSRVEAAFAGKVVFLGPGETNVAVLICTCL